MNKFLLFISLVIFSAISVNAEIVHDDFMEKHIETVNIKEPVTNTNYNYESVEKIPIKLKITSSVSTKKDNVYDEMPLSFFVKEDVKYKGKTIVKKGDVVKASVETYMERGMNGIPAVIIVDNFAIKGVPPKKIKGTYITRGLNLSLFVFPLKWALTPLPGVGSLTNLIFGGNAKISTRKTVTIYYFPEWAEF